MALGVIFIMLVITGYKRSFKTLFGVITEHRTLTSKVATLNKKAKSNNSLTKEVAYLSKVIGKDGVSKEMIQQQIIKFVVENDPKISISDLQPIHVFQDENHIVITNQLDVTGSVNQLLKLAYGFEKNFEYSRVVSMNLYTTKKNNLSDVLHLKLIFQNYENNK
jgi:hypothetical protein